MTVKIFKNGVRYYIWDVVEAAYDGIELSLVFNLDHKYSDIEEILDSLPPLGECNFRFKGVDMWGYGFVKEGGDYYFNDRKVEFNDEGETAIIAVLRDAKMVVIE